MKRLGRLFSHRCHLLPHAVQHSGRITGQTMSGPQQVQGEFTRVLFRCECGVVGVSTFDGTWTLDQLQGRSIVGATGDDILKSIETGGAS